MIRILAFIQFYIACTRVSVNSNLSTNSNERQVCVIFFFNCLCCIDNPCDVAYCSHKLAVFNPLHLESLWNVKNETRPCAFTESVYTVQYAFMNDRLNQISLPTCFNPRHKVIDMNLITPSRRVSGTITKL